MHDQAVCTSVLQILQEKYRPTRELVQNELGAILHAPALKMGDASAFHSLLKTLDGQNGNKLHCGSHVNHLLHDGFNTNTSGSFPEHQGTVPNQYP